MIVDYRFPNRNCRYYPFYICQWFAVYSLICCSYFFYRKLCNSS